MNKNILNRSLPYIAAIILFLILSFAYFPEVIQGKKLNQHDTKTWRGGAQEVLEHYEETGEHSLWTNSMFGGMPVYLLSNYTPNNIAMHIGQFVNSYGKLRPVNFLFFAMIGFFLALLLFGADPWLSILGAIAFGLSTYYLIILEAGHMTKASTIAYMPPIIAGIYYAYMKDKLKGALVVMIFLSLQLSRNHLQITYYTLLIILIYIIFQFVSSVRKKEFKKFLISSSFLLAGALIAVSVNYTSIITTYDYGKDSIRGKSELTINQENKTGGLDKDYATAWSYGKLETLNLMIPNLMGGGSVGELPKDSEIADELRKVGITNNRDILKNMPTYWGTQPGTSGPVYIGAIMIFLFIFGLFLVKGNLKWWLLTATILSVLLAWGKNFMFLTDFFLDYFPGYNKFRTVSMILVIAEFTVPLLGILAIKNIIDEKVSKSEVIRALKWSVGILSGIILLLIINPGILSFSGENDSIWFMRRFGLKDDPDSQRILTNFTSALEKDRASLFRADAFRSLIFIFLSAAAIWLFIKEKIKKNLFFVSLAVLILVDLWAVDKRYLNSEDFVSSRFQKEPFKASLADQFILKETDPNFRVLNLTVSTFNDASTSYFHKSVGGYHGAKMRRYQELITYGIHREISILYTALNESTSEFQVQSSLMNLSVLNMLNTKYFILNPDMLPMMNQYSLGNSWFVNKIKEVENADEEIKATQNFDPEQTAVIDKRFKDQFFKFKKDSFAAIKLTSYAPNKLTYKSKTNSVQLAVFSEIFYDKGWNAYIDGKLVPHMRANYVLRAMKIPAGNHNIEFRFEPVLWNWGSKIALFGSILFVFTILIYIFFVIRNIKKPSIVQDV